MRFFNAINQQLERNARTATPDDVWIPYNVRSVGVVKNPNTTAGFSNSLVPDCINFVDYLNYVLPKGVLTSNIKTTGNIVAPNTEILLGKLIGANMNVLTDQAIPITRIGSSRYQITRITVTNASTSLTAADGGVYTATSKGGTAIVAATQVYTALTSATVALDLTLAVNNTYNLDNLYLSLTGTQGGAATADIRVYGYIL